MAMAQNNPSRGTDTGLPGYSDTATRARLLKLAEWLNLSEPPISYEDGSIVLDTPLLSWCSAGGVSLDWVFCGDAKIMALAYQEKFERERPFYELIHKFDATEQRLILDALQAHQAGGVSLESALAACRVEVEAYRAGK